MKITLLDCPKSKHGRFHLVYDLAAWPAGTRHNRGWDGAHVIYEREACPKEVKKQAVSYRFICVVYKDWNVLAADETEYGCDANALRDNYYTRSRSEPAPVLPETAC